MLLGRLLLNHLLLGLGGGGVVLIQAQVLQGALVSLPTFSVYWPTQVKGQGAAGWLVRHLDLWRLCPGVSSSHLASGKEDQKVFWWMQLFTALAQVLEQVVLKIS